MSKQSMHNLTDALHTLQHGGLVIYPTESSYALGCDARNAQAVKEIFKLKGRSTSKQLPVIAASIVQVEKFFKLNSQEKKMANSYWPGPLTLLLTPKEPLAASNAATVAVRVSQNLIARSLAQHLGAPIVSTSANKSGLSSCFSVTQIKKQLELHKIHVPLTIIDIGRLPKNPPSTIVHVIKDSIQIIRQGSLQL